MRVGIIGAGLVGSKRARALGKAELAVVADVAEDRAKRLAGLHGCDYTTEWERVVSRPDVDIVVVSTPNHLLAPIATRAIEHGKHVLLEKPCARTSAELRKVIGVARKGGVRVKAGYNHRFHPAIQKAKEILDSGEAGPLMFIRGRYGHGGRPGYEREWRANPDLSGGGELIDQGTHLIDLSLWFMGGVRRARGVCRTYFWEAPVEDNCFITLEGPRGEVAFLHASWTEWKNLFSFEVFGEKGKLEVTGLGGSYGEESLTYYRMKPEMGVPDKFYTSWPGEDTSWRAEFEHFLDVIERDVPLNGTLEDALTVLKIVEEIYRQQKRRRYS